MKFSPTKWILAFLALCSILHQPILESSNKSYSTGSKILAISAVTAGSFYLLRNHLLEKEKAENLLGINPWEKIDAADLTTQKLDAIPQGFLWGAGTAAYQIEGGITNSWTYYPDQNGTKHDAGKCCNSWEMLDQDIACLQKLGAKSYRFSIEWARLQQHNENEWNEAALERYVDFCKKLKAANIQPVITLHHYSDPIWFMEKGGFTKAENIQYFVDYVEKVYTALANVHVKYFVTFNQPSGYSYKSYKSKDAPPYETNGSKESATLKNLFQAHVQSYQKIAAIAQAKEITKPMISISHQYSQMHVASGALYALSSLISTIAYKMYNGPFESFFIQGEGKEYMDFVALSYYCPKRFNGTYPFAYTQEELKVKYDKDLRFIDGNGFYDALIWAQQFKKPIFVIENGIETDSDAKRQLFLNRYLSKMNDALRDGINVIGYCHWSLLDNFEWTKGFDYHFGLFSVNREDGSFTRTLKPSGLYYKNIIALNSQTFSQNINVKERIAPKPQSINDYIPDEDLF